MPEHAIITKELRFPPGEIKTDALLYREKSYLLIPEPFTQNLFYAISDTLETRFFLASDSRLNLERLEAFFLRLYGASCEEVADAPVHKGSVTVLRSTILNGRTGEFYHPRFVRNILDYAAVDNTGRVSYCVAIRSGRVSIRAKRRFNVVVSVGFDSDLAKNRFHDLIRHETGIMKREAGFRMRVSDRKRISDNIMTESFNLINFVRIPSENDLME